MAMSGDQQTYLMGATIISVGLSATVRVVPPEGCNGGFFKIQAGGGTLAIVNGISSISSQGYLVAAGESISTAGPAIFYLAAAGATMSVALVQTYSSGKAGT